MANNTNKPLANNPRLVAEINGLATNRVIADTAKQNYLIILQDEQKSLQDQQTAIRAKGNNITDEENVILQSINIQLNYLNRRINNYSADFDQKYDSVNLAQSDVEIGNEDLKMQQVAQDIISLRNQNPITQTAKQAIQVSIDKKIFLLDKLQQNRSLLKNKQRTMVLNNVDRIDTYNKKINTIATKKAVAETNLVAIQEKNNILGTNSLSSRINESRYKHDIDRYTSILDNLRQQGRVASQEEAHTMSLNRATIDKIRSDFATKANNNNNNTGGRHI